jgi:protocatechuate 3,4-dioxygenase beta subunit
MIRGSVVDSMGRPVADARIVVVDAPAPSPDVALLTGADGTFELPTPNPGTYRLAVHADGYRAADVTVDVRGGEASTVHVQLACA